MRQALRTASRATLRLLKDVSGTLSRRRAIILNVRPKVTRGETTRNVVLRMPRATSFRNVLSFSRGKLRRDTRHVNNRVRIKFRAQGVNFRRQITLNRRVHLIGNVKALVKVDMRTRIRGPQDPIKEDPRRVLTLLRILGFYEDPRATARRLNHGTKSHFKVFLFRFISRAIRLRLNRRVRCQFTVLPRGINGDFFVQTLSNRSGL